MVTMTSLAWNRTRQLIWTRVSGVSLATWLFSLSFLLAVLGLLWDGGWHASWGRDTFFIPPHNVLYSSVTLTIGLLVFIIVSGSLRPRDPALLQVGRFQAPLGIWMVLLGGLILVAAAPFDEWYHQTFGRDDGTGLWSAPHAMGMVGGLVAALGMLLMLYMERPRPPLSAAEANLPPRSLRGLTAHDCLTLWILSMVCLIIGGLSLNFYAIRHWYRVDGTLYPLLAMLLGPAVLALGQRLIGRAGAATLIVVIPFALIGLVGLILRAADYPVVVSLPVMGLASALVLDLAYARYGRRIGGDGRWLFVAGALATLLFYPTEFLWSWLLNGVPWRALPETLLVLPVGVLAGMASVVLGARLARKLASLELLQPL